MVILRTSLSNTGAKYDSLKSTDKLTYPNQQELRIFYLLPGQKRLTILLPFCFGLQT
jgi:hypothetical protein